MATSTQDPYIIKLNRDEGVLMSDILLGTITAVNASSKTVDVTLSEPYTPRTKETNYGKLQNYGYEGIEENPITDLTDVPVIYNCKESIQDPMAVFNVNDNVLIMASNNAFFCVGFPDEIRLCTVYVTIGIHIYPSTLCKTSSCIELCEISGTTKYVVWDVINDSLVILKDGNGSDIQPPYTWDQVHSMPDVYKTKITWNDLDIKKFYWNIGDPPNENVCTWITDNPCFQGTVVYEPDCGWYCCTGFSNICDFRTPYIIYDSSDPNIHGENVAYIGVYPGYDPDPHPYWNCPLLTTRRNWPSPSEDPDNSPDGIFNAVPIAKYTSTVMLQVYAANVECWNPDQNTYESIVVTSVKYKPDLLTQDGGWNCDIFSLGRNTNLETYLIEAMDQSLQEGIQMAIDLGCYPSNCVYMNWVPEIMVVDW